MPDPASYPETLPDPPVAPMVCPRCDRRYDSGKSYVETLKIVKQHVAEQHPDHDPDWAGD